MPVKAKAEEPSVLRIIAPEIERGIITIQGTAPLLTNRMNEKARASLTDTAPTKRKGPKIYDDPEVVWRSHLHIISDEEQRYGIPGSALFAALIEAGRWEDGVFMTELRGIFRVPWHLLEIKGSLPVRDDDIGWPQSKRGAPVPIYRPRFDEWEIDVPISYDARLITLESLVSLFQRAGYSVGIGAHRPQFGTFAVKQSGSAA